MNNYSATMKTPTNENTANSHTPQEEKLKTKNTTWNYNAPKKNTTNDDSTHVTINTIHRVGSYRN